MPLFALLVEVRNPILALPSAQTMANSRRFRTIQVCPKDLRALPEHPKPAVSWHSGFRGGAHAPVLQVSRQQKPARNLVIGNGLNVVTGLLAQMLPLIFP